MKNSSTTCNKLSDTPDGSSATRSARLCMATIGAYQRLTAGRASPCRFYPSCSYYAHEAIALHGTWRGLALAARRLSRCRPLGPHGVDLVPEVKNVRSDH